MNYKNIITSIIILLVCSFIYKQFRVYIDKRDLEEELNIIDKYSISDFVQGTLKAINTEYSRQYSSIGKIISEIIVYR